MWKSHSAIAHHGSPPGVRINYFACLGCTGMQCMRETTKCCSYISRHCKHDACAACLGRLRVLDAKTFRGDVSEKFRCKAPPHASSLSGKSDQLRYRG